MFAAKEASMITIKTVAVGDVYRRVDRDKSELELTILAVYENSVKYSIARMTPQGCKTKVRRVLVANLFRNMMDERKRPWSKVS